MIHVRPYIPADRAFILSLAPRFAHGVLCWRDSHRWIARSQGQIAESMEQHGQKDMVFVAEKEKGATICNRWHSSRLAHHLS